MWIFKVHNVSQWPNLRLRICTFLVFKSASWPFLVWRGFFLFDISVRENWIYINMTNCLWLRTLSTGGCSSLCCTKNHVTLTYDLWHWKSTAGLSRCCRNTMFVQNAIKRGAASVDKLRVLTSTFALSCSGEKFENPVVWPWTLTYDLEIQDVLDVVSIHSHVIFYQDKCSGLFITYRINGYREIKNN